MHGVIRIQIKCTMLSFSFFFSKLFLVEHGGPAETFGRRCEGDETKMCSKATGEEVEVVLGTTH